MFTGLVEEIGQIIKIKKFESGIEIVISAAKVMDDLKVDDSIAVNGVCQTVVSLDENSFKVQAIKETIDKTCFGFMKPGDNVNLERAMRVDSRLGGHIVQGHVNGIASLISLESRGENRYLGFKLDEADIKYCIREGSIALHGVSLTIADITDNAIYVSLIPHTVKMTNLKDLKVGSEVNLELDMMAKYMYRFFETWEKEKGK